MISLVESKGSTAPFNDLPLALMPCQSEHLAFHTRVKCLYNTAVTWRWVRNTATSWALGAPQSLWRLVRVHSDDLSQVITLLHRGRVSRAVIPQIAHPVSGNYIITRWSLIQFQLITETLFFGLAQIRNIWWAVTIELEISAFISCFIRLCSL